MATIPESTGREVSPRSEAVVMTVAFIDLVGFTSLTDVHGDRAALEAATRLESIAHESLEAGVEVVKMLGDGVLLVAPDPLSGLRCASRIVEQLHDARAGSDARVGLDHGAVIRHRRDVFGATVNLASRLAALADRGTMVVTRPVALFADQLPLPVVPLGVLAIRGLIDDVELFGLNPCKHSDFSVVDPVCGMRIDAAHAIGSIGVGTRDLGFCSDRCAALYIENPSRYRV